MRFFKFLFFIIAFQMFCLVNDLTCDHVRFFFQPWNKTENLESGKELVGKKSIASTNSYSGFSSRQASKEQSQQSSIAKKNNILSKKANSGKQFCSGLDCYSSNGQSKDNSNNSNDDLSKTNRNNSGNHLTKSISFKDKWFPDHEYYENDVTIADNNRKCTDSFSQCIPKGSDGVLLAGLVVTGNSVVGELSTGHYLDRTPLLHIQ